jgi:hypothetical protein
MLAEKRGPNSKAILYHSSRRRPFRDVSTRHRSESGCVPVGHTYPVNLLRVDIVSVVDLRFERIRQLPQLSSRSPKALELSPILARLEESFSWLFYGQQLRDFELFDVPVAIPRSRGAALRINQRLGIGTFILWRTYEGDSDPQALKAAAWATTDDDIRSLEAYLEGLVVERFYPFVSMEADTENIDDYAIANAEEIGRILTGDLEGERPATLRKYIQADLSLRSYEKLLVRWTEALVLYSRMKSEQHYEECMFRAVQIFEHCILARVALLALAEQMEQFLRRLTIVTPPKWFKSRDLMATFSNVEESFVMYPHVQSVEADRLISDAHTQFGLDKVLASAKAKQSELRDRLEWAKAQTLGLLAFVTYLLDKIIGWENVRHFILSGLHRIFQ